MGRILEEAVVNIDDVHQRTPASALLRKSLYRLSEAAGRLVPQLTPLREQVNRSVESLRRADGTSVRTSRYALRGDAEITDWYADEGDWVALRARAPDGSMIDYRLET